MVRENKTLKSALADRDRELVALNDKLSSMRDQVPPSPSQAPPAVPLLPTLSLCLSETRLAAKQFQLHFFAGYSAVNVFYGKCGVTQAELDTAPPTATPHARAPALDPISA